ncbi:hypothetical protein D1872_306310 [compost metagenome]
MFTMPTKRLLPTWMPFSRSAEILWIRLISTVADRARKYWAATCRIRETATKLLSSPKEPITTAKVLA